MLKQIKSIIKQKITTIRHYPKKYTIGGGIGVVFILLFVVALWPRTIELSYSGGESCIEQPIIAPGVVTSAGSNDFKLVPGEGIGVAASQICAVAQTPPRAGEHTAVMSVFGLSIGKIVTIKVKAPPTLANTALIKPVPVTKPLRLTLSGDDVLFNYRLEIDKKTVACTTISGATVVCNVEKIGLKQGADYDASFYRYFDDKKVATVAKEKIKTLSAVTVTETSIKPGEMIYAKPSSMQVKFDKSVTAATAVIEQINAPEPKKVKAVAERNEEGVLVTWSEELDRMAEYQIILDEVVAADESSLAEPYKLPFKLSGGPKVTSVNVPKTGVKLGTTAVVSFDQPLSDKQDINKLVTLTGGATLAGKQNNQLLVNLGGVPKCGDFSIKLTGDIQSNYDIAGQSAWDFSGRTICHTVGSIGTSAKGRAITAYYFGNGPSSIVYTGAIHGGEASTKSLMLRWIDELEANARSIPADKSIVVIPAINPDGLVSGSRTNANNVDLNRNFGTADWKTDITTVNNTPFPKGGGNVPMSEPETKAIASLVGRLSPRLVLSYHSIGGVLAANQTGISNGYAQTYAGLSGYRNATGSGSTFEYAISGTADDYYGEKLGVASILVELGSHTYHQFERNQKAMWAMMR